MLMKSRETMCKNCQTPMYKNERICPNCGAENIRPSYRKEWLTAIMVVLLLAGVGYYRKYVANRFEWNDLILSYVLPRPSSEYGEISLNSDRYLSIDVYKISKEEYKEYVKRCQAMDFGIEEQINEFSYMAYNNDGYRLSLWYDERDKELSISLDAPMEMGTLLWPNSEIVSFLPVPKSNIGKIVSEDSENFSVYIDNMTKDDYTAYINECYENGFSIDYYKSDTYYSGKNKEGYEVYVSYEGNNVIHIRIKKFY